MGGVGGAIGSAGGIIGLFERIICINIIKLEHCEIYICEYLFHASLWRDGMKVPDHTGGYKREVLTMPDAVGTPNQTDRCPSDG